MKEKIKLFWESLKLVWRSGPGWASANIVMSVFRSFLPLLMVWLLKGVVDAITAASTATPGTPIVNVLWPVSALVLVWFLDEASSDFSNYVRKKQSLKLEVYMYGLLHSKAIKLDLINFERPEYFDCLIACIKGSPLAPKQYSE